MRSGRGSHHPDALLHLLLHARVGRQQRLLEHPLHRPVPGFRLHSCGRAAVLARVTPPNTGQVLQRSLLLPIQV